MFSPQLSEGDQGTRKGTSFSSPGSGIWLMDFSLGPGDPRRVFLQVHYLEGRGSGVQTGPHISMWKREQGVLAHTCPPSIDPCDGTHVKQ